MCCSWRFIESFAAQLSPEAADRARTGKISEADDLDAIAEILDVELLVYSSVSNTFIHRIGRHTTRQICMLQSVHEGSPHFDLLLPPPKSNAAKPHADQARAA